MRVLVANKYWRDVGGVEAHVSEVVSWLEAAGHEVVPFAMREEEAGTSNLAHFPSEVPFRTSGLRPALRTMERAVISSETRSSLARLLDERPVDAAYVVHVYHQLGMVMLDDLAARGVPTVLSLHDYKIACPNYRFFSERTGKICTTCLDHRSGLLWAPATERCWGNNALAGVALTAEAAATRLRGSYRKPGAVAVLNSLQERSAVAAGVEPSRIHRIAHPVSLGPPRPTGDRGHVLYVGRLVPEKGVDVLLKASAESGVPVTVVGTGRSEAELRRLAEQLSAPATFLGSVPRASVAGLMIDAAAVVVPSVWHEVSPLVVYEAMAMDVPVIGTRVGGVADQLAEGRGLLVEAGNVEELASALRLAVTEGATLQAVSSTAREFVRTNLTPAHWAAAMNTAFVSAGAEDFRA